MPAPPPWTLSGRVIEAAGTLRVGGLRIDVATHGSAATGADGAFSLSTPAASPRGMSRRDVSLLAGTKGRRCRAANAGPAAQGQKRYTKDAYPMCAL